MARKNLDCSECGAEYTIVAREDEDPSFCPFCGDPGANYVSDDARDEEDEDDEDDFDGYSVHDEDDE